MVCKFISFKSTIIDLYTRYVSLFDNGFVTQMDKPCTSIGSWEAFILEPSGVHIGSLKARGVSYLAGMFDNISGRHWPTHTAVRSDSDKFELHFEEDGRVALRSVQFQVWLGAESHPDKWGCFYTPEKTEETLFTVDLVSIFSTFIFLCRTDHQNT